MDKETVKRKSKDSVFLNLFSDVNNICTFYKDLHPEDTDVTPDDIEIQTIESITVNTLRNDLGFTVKDRLVILAEAQSTWNPNIALRMLYYITETYKRYVESKEESVFSSVRLFLPKPEFYVIYTGDSKPDISRPETGEVSFSEDFFGGDSPLEVRIKVLTEETVKTIYGQYIGFCKIFDGQRKIHGSSMECIKETIRICKEKDYLVPYLVKHEPEVTTMMSELFDEEYLRKQHAKSEWN
ncbi:MAG: hypothetical protein NC078_08855, partial [Ruminococcus sp.]|nr:hypothetical protein [Ruminococcus sp.]